MVVALLKAPRGYCPHGAHLVSHGDAKAAGLVSRGVDVGGGEAPIKCKQPLQALPAALVARYEFMTDQEIKDALTEYGFRYDGHVTHGSCEELLKLFILMRENKFPAVSNKVEHTR